MMKTILVNDNGDRVTKNGLFVFSTDLKAVEQTCEQVMKQQLRELQYDQTKGIEYFNNVFTGTPNFQLFEAQARNEILKVNGVTGVSSFSYEQTDNALLYKATINTIYGSGGLNGSL